MCPHRVPPRRLDLCVGCCRGPAPLASILKRRSRVAQGDSPLGLGGGEARALRCLPVTLSARKRCRRQRRCPLDLYHEQSSALQASCPSCRSEVQAWHTKGPVQWTSCSGTLYWPALDELRFPMDRSYPGQPGGWPPAALFPEDAQRFPAPGRLVSCQAPPLRRPRRGNSRGRCPPQAKALERNRGTRC